MSYLASLIVKSWHFRTPSSPRLRGSLSRFKDPFAIMQISPSPFLPSYLLVPLLLLRNFEISQTPFRRLPRAPCHQVAASGVEISNRLQTERVDVPPGREVFPIQ